MLEKIGVLLTQKIDGDFPLTLELKQSVQLVLKSWLGLLSLGIYHAYIRITS